LIVFGFSSIHINTEIARASSTIYIRPDGSVDPPTAPIQRDGNLYTFTADVYDSIQVQKPEVVIDGNGFKLQGAGTGSGFSTNIAGRLKILNTRITGFQYGTNTADCTLIKNNVITGNSVGIYAWGAGPLNISNNVITDNSVGIRSGQGIFLPATNMNVSSNILSNNSLALDLRAAGCTFANNTITDNYQGIFGYVLRDSKIMDNDLEGNIDFAIKLLSSYNNVISGNVIKYSSAGLNLTVVSPDGPSTGNTIADNVFSYNSVGVWMGFRVETVQNNLFYHNNFNDNAPQVYSPLVDYWDNGYPSGGNFWIGYNGNDIYKGPYQNLTGSDGIGDTQYTIDVNNQDHYPLMNPFGSPSPPMYALTIATSIGGTTNPLPGTYSYSQGQTVPVEATPDPAYYLDHWELNGSNVGNGPAYSVIANAPHILNAIFEPLGGNSRVSLRFCVRSSLHTINHLHLV